MNFWPKPTQAFEYRYVVVVSHYQKGSFKEKIVFFYTFFSSVKQQNSPAMRRRVKGILMSGKCIHARAAVPQLVVSSAILVFMARGASVAKASMEAPIFFIHIQSTILSLSMSVGKQFSLDSRMDLVVHGINASANHTGTSAKNDERNRAITEDGEEAWEGTKGR